VNDAGLVCGGVSTANATVYMIDTVLNAAGQLGRQLTSRQLGPAHAGERKIARLLWDSCDFASACQKPKAIQIACGSE